MHADPNSPQNTTIQDRHILCKCWAAVMRLYSPLCLPKTRTLALISYLLLLLRGKIYTKYGGWVVPHALCRCNTALLSLLRPGRKDEGWTLATSYRIRHGTQRTLCGSRCSPPRGARMLGKDGPPCNDLGRCPYRLSKQEETLSF
jgi:hypothetical protein